MPNYNRQEMVKKIDQFFTAIFNKPEQHDVHELIVLIESIIPVHAELEITSYDEVDILLSIYPLVYQKLIKLYAYFIHNVRKGIQLNDKTYTSIMRSYRDPLEELLKSVKIQYDSLSRRITNHIERR